MLVGATIDPRQYERRVPAYPESRMCRVFGYPGKGLPAWLPVTGDKRVARLHELVPGIIPACVFQDWKDDDAARALVDGWLNDVDRAARLCWRHEADRKREDPTVYRRRYYLMAEWLLDHPNGHHVTLTPTATYQWTLSTAPGKGGGDWSKFYAGVGTAALDVYANSWAGDYPDPAAFLAPVWQFRDVINQPVEFAEFGAARLPSDADGTRRADWLVECACIMATEGVTAVSYWDDMGSNQTDLRLWKDSPDTPEALAWRAVMREHNSVWTPVESGGADQG